ncbi:MAG: N-acetyltransferase [bacterium]|nr:N-acetyltransferase [bacterium]
MNPIVEPESPEDIDAIYQLNVAAFDGRTEEAELVDALRRDGDLLLSLVAHHDGVVVGHVAFSRVVIDAADGLVGGVALAPVGVDPRFQREGVGSVLIETGIALLSDESVLLVVGDPAYYTRFGFSVAAGERYPSFYSGPYFMALVVGDPAVGPIGPVTYAEAFELVN